MPTSLRDRIASISARGISRKTELALVTAITLVWLLAHAAGIVYGTENYVPLHQSYIGDEQASVNGALHMLQAHSILGFRNLTTFYYGPVFAIIDTPAIIVDFASKYASGIVHSASQYRDYIIFDWGGIIFNLHVTAVFASLLGLYAAYCLMRTKTMNPSGSRWLPYLSVGLVAINFYFFEYSHFAKHWSFIIPLILLQYYSYVRITETDGVGRKYWLIHSAATILIFGISYVGILSLLMWVPWLLDVMQTRDGKRFRPFVMYSLLMLAGFIVMFAWDPYAFIRDISFLGIGTPKGGMDTTQNPFYFANNSIVWYGTLIVLNNLAIIAAFALLCVSLVSKKIWRSGALWSLLLPALGFFLLFAPAAHHEGRYMLPTIVLIILATGYLISLYAAEPGASGAETRHRVIRSSLVALVACYVALHVNVDIKWIQIYAKGPIEKQAIATILDMQKTGAPVLVVQNYILGAPHDKASYDAYIAKSIKGNVNLYQAISSSTPPSFMPLLDVRYAGQDEFAANPSLAKKYPHAIMQYVPIPGLINQFDYFDENMMLLWSYDQLSPSYIVLK